MREFPITIFHNPACGTSRTVLALIRGAGYAPTVVEYLATGWSKPQLEGLLARMGAGPRDILRRRGTQAAELDLEAGDARLLAAMVEHPVLVERPIVETPLGTRLCRPAELVLPLLERQPPQNSSR